MTRGIGIQSLPQAKMTAKQLPPYEIDDEPSKLGNRQSKFDGQISRAPHLGR
jgi:hypothetical protein